MLSEIMEDLEAEVDEVAEALEKDPGSAASWRHRVGVEVFSQPCPVVDGHRAAV
jgi:hypothetical protein